MAKMPELPKSGGSTKWFRTSALKDMPDGATLRFVGDFTFGYECWGLDGKPHRFRELSEVPADFKFRVEAGEKDHPKAFVSGFCVNRGTGEVQGFLFTQRSICDPLTGLSNNKKWGDLEAYDVTITRQESGGKVAYMVTPEPKEALSPAEVAAWKAVKDEAVGMEALFYGGDPFSPFDEAKAKDGDIPF